MQEAGWHTPAWGSGSVTALPCGRAGCPSSCVAEPESHTDESSLLGCIYQKVGQGQFASRWPEKEAILNWVTMGVPANFSLPGLGGHDRGPFLGQRNLTLSFSIFLHLSTNTYLCERHWTNVKSLPLGTKSNWGWRREQLHYNQAHCLEVGRQHSRQRWVAAGVQVLGLTGQEDQEVMEIWVYCLGTLSGHSRPRAR